MLLYVMSEALYQSTVEPFSLHICLGVKGGREVMPQPRQSAHRVVERGGELRSVIG